jgi:hypothetical protein
MQKKPNQRTIACYTRRMDTAIAEWRLYGERAAKAGDRELANQYAKDVADLTALRDAFAAGDFAEAGRLADAMDTIVRDQIPLHVYYTIFPER